MTGSYADLWWLPVGAGGRVVVRTSRWWESLRALRARRSPRPLFHAALEVFDGEAEYVIEMTPAWGGPVGPRGVVAEGPVGSRRLGRSRLFRYEIRCWKDGVIPDRRWAVEPPRRLALSPVAAGALITRVGSAPRFVWGRDPFGIGDMWNSNSLVAWLLEGSGIDTAEIAPPRGGDAPGWRCGAVAARRGLRS